MGGGPKGLDGVSCAWDEAGMLSGFPVLGQDLFCRNRDLCKNRCCTIWCRRLELLGGRAALKPFSF